MKFLTSTLLLISFNGLLASAVNPKSEKKSVNQKINADFLSGLQFRSIGPAITSGRVIDIAINPQNKSEYYVASGSGGVWKTKNAGLSFYPIFDQEGSFSIGCITIDPSITSTIWVGSGENNNQRVAGYGDGVYKSEDGGNTWKNMGLKQSEHIGKICVDPRNSNVVFVAAYGPLWSSGGERGIYKTSDGGKTWKNTLSISENTGCNEVIMDPNNSSVLYAAAHQRRRHEWTYISGGPESALYKSTDAGETWTKLSNGLPEEDKGRIGVAVSPVAPNYVYAIVEGKEKTKGLYRSTDYGASWEKRSSYSAVGNYYQELFCDPKNPSKLYSMDYNIMVSNDGGATFSPIGEKNKHVDNHALWIDGDNTDHIINGCDGGVYETFDGAKTWHFKDNLPITQFYRVCTDNALPFYNIYGGTQDNFSLGGPSRTVSSSGIVNSDWFVTTGGDGFFSRVDPSNPNIVYAESQYGGLVRFDKTTGETVSIKPIEKEGETAYRWNWDAPLFISNFDNSRLYFAANKLFRSDNKGNSWQAISPDLTRQIDRNKLPVMGRVWSVDAIAKNASTSIYGNIISFSESPKNPNFLYAGTDDGLIQSTLDGGKTWIKSDVFDGIPDRSPVSTLLASQHDEKTLYASFNNHRNGDFKPYILKSLDAGKSWLNISSDLPARGSVYCLAEDPIAPGLLFAGTEFGIFMSLNGGVNWIQLKGGLPNIAVRDIALQKRESDIVIATFGRGFYVLDDYSLLRKLSQEITEKPVFLYPVKDTYLFVESIPIGHRGKGFRGEGFFTAPNPPNAAAFTYSLSEDLMSNKQKRKKQEKEKTKRGDAVYYPSIDSLRMEDHEEEPSLIFTVLDNQKNVVRRLKEPAKKGLHRLFWDLRYASTEAINFRKVDPDNLYDEPAIGRLAMPGKYFVTIDKLENNSITPFSDTISFQCKKLYQSSFPDTERVAINDFYNKVSELTRAVSAADVYLQELVNKIKYIKVALLETPKSSARWYAEVRGLELALNGITIRLNGDASLSKREFETLPSISSRIAEIAYGLWRSTQSPTESNRQSYDIAEKQFGATKLELKSIADRIQNIELALEKAGAPFTPGRFFNSEK